MSERLEIRTPASDDLGSNIAPQNIKNIPEISPELQAVLQHIVDDVVKGLDCVGAMVATLELGNMLPVRAYSVTAELRPKIRQLEDRLGVRVISARSVAYLDNKRFKDNLSVRAVRGINGQPQVMVSDSLYDLFRPVVPRTLSSLVQKEICIKQVIAIPFFLENEVVGNLFAAACEEFSNQDVNFLTAVSHQAATAIQSQRRLAQAKALERIILNLQASITDEKQALQTTVDAVVQKMGYVGAMVATLEANNTLPVRAYAVTISPRLIKQLEETLGVGFIGPKSIAYLNDERFKENLSVRAVRGKNGHPEIVTSDRLYDLFRPVVNETLSNLAQKLSGIKQVIAVPFFLEDELVGNLFVASRRPKFSENEKLILMTFGQQAALGIHNARLYRRTEEQRQVAQMFARMAFSAAASVHAMRNHVALFRSHLQLLQLMDQLSEEDRAEVMASTPKIFTRLDEISAILDNLHEPWHQAPDSLTNINTCLNRAINKIIPHRDEAQVLEGISVHVSLAEKLPLIKTSPDMLTESFKVLIKNAVEAIQEKGKGGDLWITTYLDNSSAVLIEIRDNGIGIKPENLTKIFEMRWSTKEGRGMGFGLFWTKDYLEGIGGTIVGESIWQEGTTFRVKLPLNNSLS